MDNSFLEEIEEEIKKDKLLAVWTKYKKPIIGVICGIILLIIIYMQWMQKKRENAEALTKETIQAFFDYSENNDIEARLSSISSSSNDSLADLMQVVIAAMKLKSQVKDFNDVGYNRLDALSKSATSPIAKDLATICMIIYEMKFSSDYESMMNRLELITFNRRPFRLTAMELLGIIAIKAGKIDRAISCFESIINDQNATQNMKSRALLFKSSITVKD